MYRSLIKHLFSTSPPSGKLYVWGQGKPPYTFQSSKVIKLAAGTKHHAFITEDGKLYTVGEGKYGSLGHGNLNSVNNPKSVQFFEKNNLKVIDVSTGEKHTLALTQNGEVWSFGRGNKNVSIFLKPFVSTVGALGHPDGKSHSIPISIGFFKQLPKITDLTSGKAFNAVINQNGDVYNWGKGQLSVFGNGSNANSQIPVLNQHFKYLRQSQKLTIKKLLSCERYSMALMSDGILYGWGANDNGQMGINETGGEMYQTYFYPTKIFTDEIGSQKIMDFEISEEMLIFKLENGDIYWAGKRAAFKPEKLIIPSSKKQRVIGVNDKALAVAVDGKIYTRFNFFKEKKYNPKQQSSRSFFEDLNEERGDENVQTAIKTTSIPEMFDDASNIVRMGGAYGLTYAIVN